MTTPRIALIHALAHSVAPINEEMARAWPDCRRMNLLDDSLSADLAASDKGLDVAMFERFETLTAYAQRAGAQGVLFTCSAFGPCIDAVSARRPGFPVLKPNEAMVAEAAATGLRIGLVATFAPTLASMPEEFPPELEIDCLLASGALDALNADKADAHDALVASAAQQLAKRGAQVIALAQFSMARARPVVERQTGLPVLTTVHSAVRELRRRLG